VPIADSTTHAESGSIFVGVKYAKYITNWMTFLKDYFILKVPVIIFNDNNAAISIMSTYSNNSKSKHFNISLFYVRDLVDKGVITILYVKSMYNRADMMTKPLHYPILYGFTKKLFLIEEFV